MRYELRYRKQVPRDISSICRWYDAQQAGLRDQFLDELEEVLDRIKANPEGFARGEESHFAQLKRFPFLVYFKVRKTHIVIAAITHKSRDPEHWKRRL
mgnify:CR=1 FL=1